MNKLPIFLLITGAILCLISIGLQGYADGQGTVTNTTWLTATGAVLVVLGAYLNAREDTST